MICEEEKAFKKVEWNKKRSQARLERNERKIIHKLERKIYEQGEQGKPSKR
jgi:hypothetical protein